MVPLSIRFGSEEFVDGTTLSTEEFWARCAASSVLPETVGPLTGRLPGGLRAAADQGYDGVLCLTLSSGVSATYQSAVTAAKDLGDGVPVRVIDSRSMTMGLGLMVLDVADLAASGADLDDAGRPGADAHPPHPVSESSTRSSTSKRGAGSAGPGPSWDRSCPSSRWSPWSTGWSKRSRSSGPGPVAALPGRQGRELPTHQPSGREQRRRHRHRRLPRPAQGVHTEYPLVVVDLGPVVGTHTGPGTVGLCIVTSD